MVWDSEQYLKFAAERKQPCLDLIARLEDKYSHVLDLGCGPGNSTVNLKDKFPNAEIIGFDSDDDMIIKARTDHPEILFVKGAAPQDLKRLTDKFDLVFSNACLQWIDDQSAVIDEVSNLLDNGGTFAAQVPIKDQSMFYSALEILLNGKWKRLNSVRNWNNIGGESYYNLLIKHFSKVSIFRTDYYHIIDSKDMVIEWYKGSGLRPYLSVLSKEEQAEFIIDLTSKINDTYPTLADGKTFLIMPRLFFIARK